MCEAATKPMYACYRNSQKELKVYKGRNIHKNITNSKTGHARAFCGRGEQSICILPISNGSVNIAKASQFWPGLQASIMNVCLVSV